MITVILAICAGGLSALISKEPFYASYSGLAVWSILTFCACLIGSILDSLRNK